jgi:fimbrial chaperone protein
MRRPLLRVVWLAACLACALLLLNTTAHAGSVRVGPTLINLSAAHPVAAVQVTNNNDVTTAYETQLVLWEQDNNNDVYTPVSNVIATPPIFELAPGATQVLRVGLLNDAPEAAEQALRLYVAEVPVPSSADDSRLKMAMRVGIPVFIRPAFPAPAKLAWNLVGTPDGYLLQVNNTGRSHVKLLDLQLYDHGTRLAANLPSRYVLPGATRQWAVSSGVVPATARSLELQVTTQDSTERATLAVAPAEPGSQ